MKNSGAKAVALAGMDFVPRPKQPSLKGLVLYQTSLFPQANLQVVTSQQPQAKSHPVLRLTKGRDESEVVDG